MEVFKIFTISLLLFGHALSATCPPQEDISPCLCLDDEEDVDLGLVCSDSSLTIDELKRVLNTVGSDVTLDIDIQEMNIGILPSDIFEGLKVERLSFSHCYLDSLAEDGGQPLSGLQDTLLELNIYSSFHEVNVPTKLELSHLRSLLHLDISDNVITELDNEWFERGLSSLTRLILSNNGIEKLGDRAFANLMNIQELSLDGNRFGEITRNMFPNPSTRLQELQLDNNAFTSIPDDLFSGMPALRSVALRTNGISRMPQSTWQGVWEQLEFIDLRGNPLDCDSHIDWILNSNTLAVISGRCETPREREGIDLEDLALRI